MRGHVAARDCRAPRAFPAALLVICALSSAAAMGALTLATPSVAFAEPTEDEIKQAKARFEEGKAFQEKDQWAEALAAFEDVAKVKMTAQVRFQIAYCEENLKRPYAALLGFQEALKIAESDPDKAKQVLSAAPERIAIVTPHVPVLTIKLTSAPPTDAEIRILLDGKPVAPDLFGKPIQLEIGEHTVDLEVTQGSEKESSRVEAFSLGDGQKKTVSVEPVTLLAEEPKPKPPIETPLVETPGNKLPAVIVGSAGIAGLILSGVFLGLRESAISEVRASCDDPDAGTGCDPGLQDLANKGKTYTYVSASMGVLGIAAMGTATVLWFTVGASKKTPAPKSGAPVSQPAVDADLIVGPTFLGVRGTF